MASNIKELIKVGQELFSKRTSFISLQQEIAENFYPERADFTAGTCLIGADFAGNLMNSYPVLARRDLGNALSSMLRPTSKDWMEMTIRGRDNLSNAARKWLQEKTKLQRKIMYDRRAGFTKATKQGDHDFATFGQCVISVETNKDRNRMLYRNWHIRDVAWMEDETGQIDTIYHRMKMTVREILHTFGDRNLPQAVKTAKDNNQLFTEFEVWRVITPSKDYVGDKVWPTPYVSVYLLKDEEHELECVGSWTRVYVIPRWQTISGSQYAYSPATIAALPDARLIQAMSRVLLEAGEKAVTPPMIATRDAIRGDVAVYAGGITWVDSEYDEKLGEVLRPLTQDRNGVPLGIEMQRDVQAMIQEAFYLNKLSMPQTGEEMTAYEVGQRVQEYIRQAMPIFEPMEDEYNGELCEMTFETIMRVGGFGPMDDLPRELSDEEVSFSFESPLHDATERAKGQRLLEAKSMLADAMALDQSAAYILDAKEALRDVLNAIGVPAKWVRDESVVEQMAADDRDKMDTAQLLQQMQQGADVAATMGVSA
jgi:hypothetical protein